MEVGQHRDVARQQAPTLQCGVEVIRVGQSSLVAICASSPEVVHATKSTSEEESTDEHATPHVWSAVEDGTRMKRCGNWSDTSLRQVMDAVTNQGLKLKTLTS